MNSTERFRIIADLSIVPMGLKETSIGHYIAAVIEAIEKINGLETRITPMGTIIEAENMATILEAVRIAHETLASKGIKRIFSTIRIDDRRDKHRTMQDKTNAIEKRLQNT